MAMLLSGELTIKVIDDTQEIHQVYRDSHQQEFKQDPKDVNTGYTYQAKTINKGLRKKLRGAQRHAACLVLMGSEM